MRRRRFTVLGTAALLVVSLSACQITITPGPPPLGEADYTFTANDDFLTSVGSVSIPVGASRTVDVVVPSALRGSSRKLVVEVADGGTYALDMVMYESNRTTPYASTSGGAYFAPGLDGLGRGFLQLATTSLGGLGTSSVAPGPQCQGPCIAKIATDSVVRVRVDNEAGLTTLDVDVYAYVDGFLDVGEPGNDTIANAEVVDTGTGAAGMIELLGDRDYVAFPSAGLISFREAAQGIDPYVYDANLRLRIVNDVLEQQVVLVPGQDYFVQAGWYGIVYSDASDPRATVGGEHNVFYD